MKIFFRHRCSQTVIAVLGLLLSGGLLIVQINRHIIKTGQPLYTKLRNCPEAPVAIVLGAAVWRNRYPSHVLRDRLYAAIQLYKAGKVNKLLVSGARRGKSYDAGARRGKSYDETLVMFRYARSWGIPARDLLLDPAGFSTYDSMFRAARIFRIKKAVIVTQNFHLSRAVYLAHAFSIEAVGFSADRGSYRDIVLYRLREILARVKAWLEAELLRPDADVMTPPD